MITSDLQSRVLILVKALPQPSKTYGETVCCAGVTTEGKWKRLFPVRYRHLSGDAAFSRWDWVSFKYRKPTSDVRHESCHVFEDSISIGTKLPAAERARFLEPVIVPSSAAAQARGSSLALIRPVKSEFYWKARSQREIEAQREAFQNAAKQHSIFDKELAEIEPTPYDLRFRFTDEDGAKHDCANGDWEAHGMFWNYTRNMSESDALRAMAEVFNEKYPKKGMALALGNQAKRPNVWQLLGVVRLDRSDQGELF